MKLSPETIARVEEYIDAHKNEMIAMWRDFVDTRSDTLNKEKTEAMAAKLVKVFQSIGCTCETFEVSERSGPGIVAWWGKENPGTPVLFSGHYDTVPLKGEHPFTIDEENRAHGLGCLDMKGGIVMSIWIVKALQALGWHERPVKLVFVGDEENGHQFSTTKEFLLEHTGGAAAAFNMETGLVSNAICVGRKGTGQATLTVHGVAAHSGNNYLEGRSAISEMANKIKEVEALTDLAANTTVAVTMLQGGTVENSIPPICTAIVDLRFGSVSERNRVMKALEDICAVTTVEGTSAEFEYREFMAPFDTTPDVKALADFVSTVSEDLGCGSMGRVFLGGGSDASFVTLAGVPCICSIGVRGQFNHSDQEYALVESLFQRTKLLACCVMRLDEFEARG